MIPLYYGFDEREEVGAHTFASSVICRASVPVALTPLHLPMFRRFYTEGHRDGTNAFIYTRFLVPYLQGFKGWAVFADGADMVCLSDIDELWALRDLHKAVQVVKHEYTTRHPRKYVGTAMESINHDYPRKNWSSLMLLNCSHFAWREMRPETVARMSGPELHRFGWIPDEQIGGLPMDWNWLADEYGENAQAKLLHWTAGIPGFKHYAEAPHAEQWWAERYRVTHATD